MATDTHEQAIASESIPQLLKDLRNETTDLLRQEMALAKQETSEKIAKATRNVGYLIAGGLVGYAGMVILVAALAVVTYGILVAAEFDHMVAGWLAPLIVGGLVAVVGAILIGKAITTFSDLTLVPERTVESLQKDKELIKEKVTS